MINFICRAPYFAPRYNIAPRQQAPVQNGGQIKPAFLGFNAGDVTHPDLVGRGGLWRFGQAVEHDRFVMVAVGGVDAVTALLAAAESLHLHDPGDAVASVVAPLFAQLILDARTTVSLPAPGMDGLDGFGQRLVFCSARTGRGAAFLPVVVAAGGDF